MMNAFWFGYVEALFVYALLVLALAWLARQTNPGWTAARVAFWAGAFLPLLGLVLVAGDFLLLQLPHSGGGPVRYEGNLFGLAILIGLGMVLAGCAVVGFAIAWLFMKWRGSQ